MWGSSSFASPMSEEALYAEIAELKRQLAVARAAAPVPAPARGAIAEMSAEVVDSNPYSRLMALKRMGIVPNYEEVRCGVYRAVGSCCAGTPMMITV